MTLTLRSLTLAALLGSALALPNAALSEDVVELSVALGVDDANFNPTTASVFQLADSMGFYAKHGVKVNFVALDGTPQAAAALQAGAVDVADISIDAAVRLRAGNDVKVKGFASVSIGSPFLIAAKDGINTLADLAGKSYAIADNGSLDHQLTMAVLRANGIDPMSPAWVAIGAPPVRVQALAAGQVDATTVSFGTYASIDGTPGVHVLLPADEFSAKAPALSKLLMANESTLAEKNVAITRFTEALIDAARTLQANPGQWVEAAVAARPDLPRERLELTAKFIATRWCVNGCMPAAGVDGSIAFVYENPELKGMPVLTAADLVDFSINEAALKDLGVAKDGGMDARP